MFRRTIVGSVLAIALVLVAVTMLAPDYGQNEAHALPAPALNTIAQKNDNAATTAAAAMRQRSARTARIADALQDQQDRENAAQ